MANVPEMADNEKDQPRTLGRLHVQDDTEVLAVELLLDRVVVNNTWVLQNGTGTDGWSIMPEIAKLSFLRRRIGMSQSREAGRSKTHTPQ